MAMMRLSRSVIFKGPPPFPRAFSVFGSQGSWSRAACYFHRAGGGRRRVIRFGTGLPPHPQSAATESIFSM